MTTNSKISAMAAIDRLRAAQREAAAKRRTISLPVQPQDQSRVDESYRLHGRGSIDQRFGTDFGNEE